MAIISEFQDDQGQQQQNEDQLPSTALHFSSVLDPSKPLAFLEEAFDFVAKGSELFRDEQAEEKISGLVRSLKGRDAEERRKKAAAEERGLDNGGKAEKRMKEEVVKEVEAKAEVTDEGEDKKKNALGIVHSLSFSLERLLALCITVKDCQKLRSLPEN